MFGLNIKTTNEMDKVAKAAERAAFRNLGHASNRIMKDARESIDTNEEPSAAGSPPHTKAKRGQNLRSAIRYDANKDDAYIGPIASAVGEVGRAHELGEEIHGQEFDERPFMLPALTKNLDRFHKDWKGAIVE